MARRKLSSESRCCKVERNKFLFSLSGPQEVIVMAKKAKKSAGGETREEKRRRKAAEQAKAAQSTAK